MGYDSNDPYNFMFLKPLKKRLLLNWISSNIQKRIEYNDKYNSYKLKHIFSKQTNIYVDNGQFKGAMLFLKFKPRNFEETNWSFKISSYFKGTRIYLI